MEPLFVLLKLMRERPGMFFGVPPQTEASLYQLEMFLHGYQNALAAHHVTDDVTDFVKRFADHLRGRYGWSMSCGPFYALLENSSTPEVAWERFWVEVEAFAAASTTN
jgi:hypothetical protein